MKTAPADANATVQSITAISAIENNTLIFLISILLYLHNRISFQLFLSFCPQEYSDEYKFNTNSVKLDSLVSETDGNFINKPEEVFEGKLEKEYKKINLTNLLLILALILFLFDIAYRRLNLDFSKYIKIGIRNKKKKTNEKNFVKKELAVEKEVDNARTTEKSSDSLKDEVKKKEKKSKLKKEKRVEKSRSQTLDTNALLKKKKDRNGV